MSGTEEKQYAYWLSAIPGIGSRKIQKLLQQIGSPRDIFRASREELRQADSLRPSDLERLLASRQEEKVKRAYDNLQRQGISFLCWLEEEYPQKLRHIYNPPFSLFYKGQLPEEGRPAVAVVGGRAASYAAREIAGSFGRQLAENGIAVISGMALGVDIAAQRGALSVAGGKTYGVLGCGVDICYPRQHIESYMQMQEQGGVLSEFPPGVQPLPGNFPMRNRIISGLSDGILVIEAREKSGSLITAELGAEQGKDVFVVPGDITAPGYAGSNRLIQNGAALVTCVGDLMDGLGIFLDENVSAHKKKNEVMLETTEKIVYSYLSLEPIHLSGIARMSGLCVQDIMEALVSMELKGVVRDIGNHYYAISSLERMEYQWRKIW